MSRAATEHSEFLDDNPEEKISAVVTIQKIFRGFVQRKKIKALYGGNIGQKVASAIMIQKIFRGKRGRILSWVTDALNEVQKHRLRNCNRVMDNFPMNLRRINLNLINTSKSYKFCEYQWVKPDGGMGGGSYLQHISQGKSYGLRSFAGHWFKVCLFNTDPSEDSNAPYQTKYFMIPFNIKNNSVFDVNTGVTMTREHWDDVKEIVINPFNQRSQELRGASVQENENINRCNCIQCLVNRSYEINLDAPEPFQFLTD